MPKNDLDIIREFESSGNNLAVGKAGEVGLFQISAILLKDYNDINGTFHEKSELFDGALNKRIASWYWDVRIPQFIKTFKLADTKLVRSIIWNMNNGLGQLINRRLKVGSRLVDYDDQLPDSTIRLYELLSGSSEKEGDLDLYDYEGRGERLNRVVRVDGAVSSINNGWVMNWVVVSVVFVVGGLCLRWCK